MADLASVVAPSSRRQRVLFTLIVAAVVVWGFLVPFVTAAAYYGWL